jgi:hypothetical protein
MCIMWVMDIVGHACRGHGRLLTIINQCLAFWEKTLVLS